jgi:hypothetical protein
MKLRTIIASVAIAAASAGSAVAITGGAPAHASGTVTETVTQVNRMISDLCYQEVRTEVRYYSHSAGHGWRLLPAPAKTVSVSTHCYAR